MKILVVATHPDDETLGCGGTLLRYRQQQVETHWMIVSDMTSECGFSTDAIAIREHEIAEVANKYQFSSVHRLGFPATRLDQVPMSQLIQSMSAVIQQVQPNVIFLPFSNDVHTDHQQTFKASYSCTKSFRYPFIQKIMAMETLSETDFSATSNEHFVPTVFIDISDQLEQKIAILGCFKSELQPHPFPRSEKNIRALATLRGAAAGCQYAESFMLLKEII